MTATPTTEIVHISQSMTDTVAKAAINAAYSTLLPAATDHVLVTVKGDMVFITKMPAT